MDPKLQAELERLIRAEAQRTEQENFDSRLRDGCRRHRIGRLRFVHLDSNGSRPLKNSARLAKERGANNVTLCSFVCQRSGVNLSGQQIGALGQQLVRLPIHKTGTAHSRLTKN
jgi:hypothetical protein